MSNTNKVVLINKRQQSYSATIPTTGNYYEWLPATEGFEDSQEVEMRDVQYMNGQTTTFREGYLYIEDETLRKRFGLEKETVKTSTMSTDEIVTLLGGNINKMKKVLDENKENKSFIREVVDIAKGMKLDSSQKLQYLSEISGTPVEVITESIK